MKRLLTAMLCIILLAGLLPTEAFAVTRISSVSATVSKAFEYSAWAMMVVSYAFPACPASTINFVAIELPGLTKVGNVLEAPENGYIPFEIKSASEDISLYPELNINRYG